MYKYLKVFLTDLNYGVTKINGGITNFVILFCKRVFYGTISQNTGLFWRKKKKNMEKVCIYSPSAIIARSLTQLQKKKGTTIFKYY